MGGRDDIYIPPLQHRNYNLIQNVGYVVTTKVDPAAHHETEDPAENRWAAKWIAEAFFAKSRGAESSRESVSSPEADAKAPSAQVDAKAHESIGWRRYLLCG